MQCLRRRIDFRRCLAFLLPPLLLMLYQLLFSEYSSLYPDARLFLSIADNFLHTGHFIQTDRAGVEIVVPPIAVYNAPACRRDAACRIYGAEPVVRRCVVRVFIRHRAPSLWQRGCSCIAYTVIVCRVLPPSNLYVGILLPFHALLAAVACVPARGCRRKTASRGHRRLPSRSRHARCWRRSMLRSCCTRCGNA